MHSPPLGSAMTSTLLHHWNPVGCALILASAASLTPQSVLAHSFGQVVTLPVPVWMYLYGAATALVLSFLMCALFIQKADQPDAARTLESPPAELADIGRNSWL